MPNMFFRSKKKSTRHLSPPPRRGSNQKENNNSRKLSESFHQSYFQKSTPPKRKQSKVTIDDIENIKKLAVMGDPNYKHQIQPRFTAECGFYTVMNLLRINLPKDYMVMVAKQVYHDKTIESDNELNRLLENGSRSKEEVEKLKKKARDELKSILPSKLRRNFDQSIIMATLKFFGYNFNQFYYMNDYINIKRRRGLVGGSVPDNDPYWAKGWDSWNTPWNGPDTENDVPDTENDVPWAQTLKEWQDQRLDAVSLEKKMMEENTQRTAKLPGWAAVEEYYYNLKYPYAKKEEIALLAAAEVAREARSKRSKRSKRSAKNIKHSKRSTRKRSNKKQAVATQPELTPSNIPRISSEAQKWLNTSTPARNLGITDLEEYIDNAFGIIINTGGMLPPAKLIGSTGNHWLSIRKYRNGEYFLLDSGWKSKGKQKLNENEFLKYIKKEISKNSTFFIVTQKPNIFNGVPAFNI